MGERKSMIHSPVPFWFDLFVDQVEVWDMLLLRWTLQISKGPMGSLRSRDQVVALICLSFITMFFHIFFIVIFNADGLC